MADYVLGKWWYKNRIEETMNDKKFQQLRRQIHKKIFELIALQKLHNRETGQDYIASGPLPEPEEPLFIFFAEG